MIELFGTGMSLVVALSLMQKNIRWLRIINAVGAFGFSVYGYLIESWPVTILNLFIVGIDIFYLNKLRNTDDDFDFLPVVNLMSPYVQKFIEFHLKDIHRFMPEFDQQDREGVEGSLILRNMQPVALILYRKISSDKAQMLLDYSIPQYRDYRNTKFFLDYVLDKSSLSESHRILATGNTKVHSRYLRKMGFMAGDPEGDYELLLK